MKLVALTPAEVYARWDWIKAGAQRVVEKTGSRYRTEDVYFRLRTSPPTAWTYVFRQDDGADVGFVTLTEEFDPDGLVLFVWILWTARGAGRPNEKDFYDQMKALAKAAGAKRIRMQSPRKGWERERFFEQVAVVYEHEIV